LEITEAGFVLLERAPGVSVDFIKQSTEGRLTVHGEIPEIQF
jgi:acyl CoA:acetate/3-ketoacid CoA transferase beta subunit